MGTNKNAIPSISRHAFNVISWWKLNRYFLWKGSRKIYNSQDRLIKERASMIHIHSRSILICQNLYYYIIPTHSFGNLSNVNINYHPLLIQIIVGQKAYILTIIQLLGKKNWNKRKNNAVPVSCPIKTRWSKRETNIIYYLDQFISVRSTARTRMFAPVSLLNLWVTSPRFPKTQPTILFWTRSLAVTKLFSLSS